MSLFPSSFPQDALDILPKGGATPTPNGVRSRLTSDRSSRIFLFFFVSDVIALGVSVLLGSWIASVLHNLSSGSSLFLDTGTNASHTMGSLMPICLGVLLYMFASGEYRIRFPFWSEFGRLITAAFCALLATGFWAFAFQISGPRSALLLPWIIFPFFGEFMRQCARRILHALRLWQIPTILIGNPTETAQVRHVLASETLSSYEIIGSLSPEAAMGSLLVSGSATASSRNQFLLCLDPTDTCSRDIIEWLTRRRVPFALIPQISGMPTHGLTQSSYFSHDTIILSYKSNLENPFQRRLKFTFDFLAALLLLILVLPVYVILYVMIALDGGQPIYGHRRIGQNGREFKCLKFRSMAKNSDELLKQLLATDPLAAAEWQETQKLRNDPRITRVGHFIRKTSLDELPQLVNVLRGDMSLVGPRPIVQAEVHHYGENFDYYQAIRPGITGLWQVSGRSDTGYAERVQLDRWYVRNWTLWHDIAILAKTLPAVFLRRGAR
ncbi:undecaprenyl-phosphate galactose phosphotransferase WbaP [Gluconobacter kondonii]|uniref:undecaprenyl-phosphate galactose phosphotransferase WbaP n=1 Tax=Gluconobacter kondonii TaxID=941463 RepID=UPI0020125DCE|nr:undecaprenyl-phosphate galactose phosphotransferase WbaP [Gluconobacter kondonii]